MSQASFWDGASDIPVSACSECGRPVDARGLCGAHYKRLLRGPSTLWHRDELLAEVDALAGETPERIAGRLGVTAAAIERAARRACRADLARIFGRAYYSQRKAVA